MVNRSPLYYKKNPGSPDVVLDVSKFTGNMFYVDSTATGKGDTVGHGTTPDAPFATLDYAIGLCTADVGDTIFVMPGHAETLTTAGAVTVDVAGINIVFLGTGEKRAKFTFTNTAATIAISAANVTMKGGLFINGVDAQVKMFNITGADLTFSEFEIRDNNASYQCTNPIVTTAAADRLKLLDFVIRANGGKTGAASAIKIVGGNDHIIVPKWIDGDYSTALIENVTTACDNIQIFGRGDFPAYLRTRNSADVIVTLVSTTKGRVGPNLNARLQDNAANITEAFVGAAAEFFQPINIVNAGGESSMQTNITASTDA